MLTHTWKPRNAFIDPTTTVTLESTSGTPVTMPAEPVINASGITVTVPAEGSYVIRVKTKNMSYGHRFNVNDVSNDPPGTLTTATRGVANGVAPLGADGRIPDSALPERLGRLVLPSPRSATTYISLEEWAERAFNPPAAEDTPTVAFSSTTATSLTSPKVFKPLKVGIGSNTTNWDGKDDPNFRFGSGLYYTNNGGNADLALGGMTKPGGAAQAARWPVILTFETTADVIEIFNYGGANESFRVQINDKWLTETLFDRSSVTTAGIKTTLTFPSAKVRKVALISAGTTGFSEVRIPTTAALWKPKATIKRRGAIVGDSFVGGAGSWTGAGGGGAGQVETWGMRLLHLMGSDDPINAGIGGTGWTAGSGSATPNNYITRMDQVLAFNPDFLVLYGSVNDPQNGTGIQAAAEAVLAKAAGVKEVYVVSTFTSGWEAHRNALKLATEAHGKTFIDMAGFIHGTGRFGSPAGNGNADLYKLNDGTHPTTEAHRVLARRVFEAINGRFSMP